MAIKTGFEPAKLKPILLNTGLQQKDQPTYQFLSQLLQGLINLNNAVGLITESGTVTPVVNNVNNIIQILEDGSGGGDGDIIAIPSSALGETASDYVVASDGGTPPLPLNDGFGNFIYVQYTP